MKTNRNKTTGRGACIAFALIGLVLAVQGCSAQAHLQRRTPATRFSLDYVGNVSSAGGVKVK